MSSQILSFKIPSVRWMEDELHHGIQPPFLRVSLCWWRQVSSFSKLLFYIQFIHQYIHGYSIQIRSEDASSRSHLRWNGRWEAHYQDCSPRKGFVSLFKFCILKNVSRILFCSNVKLSTPYTVNRRPDEKLATYLDTEGRKVIVIEKNSLVDAHIQPFTLEYQWSRLYIWSVTIILMKELSSESVANTMCDMSVLWLLQAWASDGHWILPLSLPRCYRLRSIRLWDHQGYFFVVFYSNYTDIFIFLV